MHAEDLIYFRACKKVFTRVIRAETLRDVTKSTVSLFYGDKIFSVFSAGLYCDISSY